MGITRNLLRTKTNVMRLIIQLFKIDRNNARRPKITSINRFMMSIKGKENRKFYSKTRSTTFST